MRAVAEPGRARRVVRTAWRAHLAASYALTAVWLVGKPGSWRDTLLMFAGAPVIMVLPMAIAVLDAVAYVRSRAAFVYLSLYGVVFALAYAWLREWGVRGKSGGKP